MGNYYIVGTAGHIDHGKSALIEKLTGINPDRLVEEQKRGITLDIGFSYLDYDDLSISFVDVPGHEKLIKNMLVGAMGFDMCLFAVDAKEKIKAQTIEHANIINFLGVKNIIVAVTKTDLISTSERDVAIAEIKSFFENYNFHNIHVMPVSIYDEASINNLKQLIIRILKGLKPKDENGPFLMHIDRRFIVKGFGVVVTGTALQGVVRKNDVLAHLPSSKRVGVKNLHIHNKSVQYAPAGSRVAINITGLNVDELKRGDSFITPSSLILVKNFYAKISVFNNLPGHSTIKSNRTYPIFIGTDHFSGKFVLLDKKEIRPGESAFAKIYLDRPYPPYIKEPFIIRGSSPQTTLGGGTVVAISHFNLKKGDVIKLLEFADLGNVKAFLELVVYNRLSVEIPPIMQFLPLNKEDLHSFVNNNDLIISNNYLINKKAITMLKRSIINEVEKLPAVTLSTLQRYLKDLPMEFKEQTEREIVGYLKEKGFYLKADTITKEKLSSFELQAEAVYKKMVKDINLSNTALLSKELGTDEKTAMNYLKYLINKEKIVRLDDKNYMAKGVFYEYIKKIEEIAKKTGYVDVNILKDNLSLSRKFLIAFLEYLDKTGKFINKNNKRYLKHI